MSSLTEVIIINISHTFRDIDNRTLVILAVLLFCFAWVLYQSGLLIIWLEDEEYGHGMMVVGLLVYLLFRNRSELLTSTSNIHAGWPGIFLTLIALLLFSLGELSGITAIQMYSIWIFAVATTFSIGGLTLFKKLLIPLCIIFLLIPLPNVIGPMLTSQLQLISSKIGVWVIRLFGGVVYLEGNVIDMGGVKLLVAEACAGLRYLFPLMSIGAIAGYLMRAPAWMRWSLFLVTIPVTIFMNSFRIGVTGLLTEAYGSSHTEGFLHFFEGWVVFVTSLLIIIGFAWLLIKSLSTDQIFSNVFSFDHLFNAKDENKNVAAIEQGEQWQKKISTNVIIGGLLIAVFVSSPLAEREESLVESKPFSLFPKMLGRWEANESRLPASVVESAAASDYYNGTFTSPEGKGINLYISYYADQKLGPAPHSPELCIPGDGWKITSNKPIKLKSKNGDAIEANRLIITKGEHKIITYYWLKQGKNIFLQQYMARINLIWFAIKENRADAALIRMVSEVGRNERIEDTDARMQEMAKDLLNVISYYVPD